MPDYFIPIDTTRVTAFHRNIIARGVFNRFIMNYIDRNRDELRREFPTFKAFNENYFVSDDTMNELLKRAKEDRIARNNSDTVKTVNVDDGVRKTVISDDITTTEGQGLTERDLEEFQQSTPLIRLQIKAFIARDLWDMNEYFQVWNQENDTYIRALEIIRDENKYNRLLGR
jgi:carboxyl-terminal processing protease